MARPLIIGDLAVRWTPVGFAFVSSDEAVQNCWALRPYWQSSPCLNTLHGLESQKCKCSFDSTSNREIAEGCVECEGMHGSQATTHMIGGRKHDRLRPYVREGTVSSGCLS